MGVGMKYGKIFEADILGSIPENLYKMKLKDTALAWGKTEGSNTRFSSSNVCDLIVHDGEFLHLWELKSRDENFIELSKKVNKEGKITSYGGIRVNQLEGLMDAYTKKNVEAGFLFNMRDKQKTFFVAVTHVYRAIIEENKKSLNLEWIEQHGTLIPQARKGRSKLHWNYDLGVLLDNLVHMCK